MDLHGDARKSDRPLLMPLVSLRTVHSSIVPKRSNIALMLSSFSFLDTMPINSFLSTIQFNPLFHITQSNTILTVYRLSFIIDSFYRQSCSFQLNYSRFSFSLICMFQGNREGISDLPCSTLVSVDVQCSIEI